MRDTVTDLKNTVRTISSMGVKATNNVSGSVAPPEGSLRWFIERGTGTMVQDETNPSIYHATVGGATVDYIFKNGALYDLKTNAIVGTPVSNYVMVSGDYYNSFFGGGPGYAEHTVQNIGGKNYVVYKVGNQTFYANGTEVRANNRAENTNSSSATDIQRAFQSSANGGNFDNSKNGLQCVDFTKWFISTYTDLQWVYGNGWEQAAKIAAENGLPAPSSTPKAWSVFSVEGWHRGWGSRGTSDAGHTGIVISVDEKNKKCTVIETYNSLSGGTLNSKISIYSYPDDAVTFTYIGDHMK